MNNGHSLSGRFARVHSDEVIGRARELWDRGLSVRLIGVELGLSRNQVIGIAHRSGFPPRPSPVRKRIKPKRRHCVMCGSLFDGVRSHILTCGADACWRGLLSFRASETWAA